MFLRRIALFAISLLFLTRCVHSWLKCKEVSFCDKLRSSATQFAIKDIKVDETCIEATLFNKKSSIEFQLKIEGLEEEILHVVVQDSKTKRYQIKDVLDPSAPKPVPIMFSDEKDKISFENVEVFIKNDPFQLNVFKYGKSVLVVNSEQKLFIGEEEQNVEIGLDFKFPEAVRAYGIPEHADHFSLRSTKNCEPYRLLNSDNYGYKVNSTDALYGSIPVLYGHGLSMTSGIFWLNSAETFVDINNDGEKGVSAHFMSAGGALEFYVLTGPFLSSCVMQYAKLTGVAPLPQTFVLGHHQSRYSYMTETEVQEVSKKFTENKFPLDVLWLDIDYTESYKYFTWNKTSFPNPDKLLDYLNSKGRKAVTVIDPHYKVEKGYFVYDHCEKNNYFIKNSNGTSYRGECWPGLSSYIDFLNPRARKYYSELFKSFAKKPNHHIWNDMNEPSVFEGEYEKSMSKDNLHYQNVKHRDVHNIYGFYQTIGTYEGLLERNKKKNRPFVLTRSHFAGSQRYAAMWTGDTNANWDNLKFSLPMCLNEAIAGMSLCGSDVGGFVGNPSEELLQRWYQLGAWMPFFRAHADKTTEKREPYLFSKEVQNRIRKAIQMRYAHLPYWYTVFWDHYKSGEPVIRPIIYQYNEVDALDVDNQALIGTDVLICPVTEEGPTYISVYLPGGEDEIWYYNGISYSGTGYTAFSVTLDSIPVFYRGGRIIPGRLTPRESTAFMKNDPITLYINLDKHGAAYGKLYDDDYETFDYQNNKYNLIGFKWVNNVLENNRIDDDANIDKPVKLNKVFVFGHKSEVKGFRTEQGTVNKQVYFTKNENTLVLENLDVDITKPFVIRHAENSFK